MYIKARQRTKNRILNVGMQALMEKGYANLTVTYLANSADIGRGTFYQYFDDVDDLIFTLIYQTFHQLHAEIHQMMATYESPEKEMQAWRVTYRHLAQVKPIYMMLADGSAPHLVQRFEEELIATFQASLATQSFLYPQWMDLPLDVMATFSGGAVMTLIRYWFADKLNYSADEMAQMTYQLLYHQPN